MTQPQRKVVIIGAGIAGLCAGIYARKCGYDVEIVEMHDSAGGLATSWQREGYTFETCLHWLYGSNPASTMHAHWQEVCDIDKLSFVYPEEFVRLTRQDGQSLSIYTNVERLEAELLKCAPQDATEIRRLVADIRKLSTFEMPDFGAAGPRKWMMLLLALPYLPTLLRWSRITSQDYAKRFTHPLLRCFFSGGETGHLSALVIILMLTWLNRHNAGYVIGGSQAIIRLILTKLDELGGHLRLGTKVDKILVDDDAAVGVELADGETIRADWVISAADGHATIFDLLGGKYTDKTIAKAYDTRETFPSYLQVSLGIARDLANEPGFTTRLLDRPLALDPRTNLDQVSFRFFHFDPTFAPPGKTAVTCFLPTYDFAYWAELQKHDLSRYQAEKRRVAEAIIAILTDIVGDLRSAIEVVDVATPATVIRYTGNWKGSMQGWLFTPRSGLRSMRKTLPGLRQFLMVGQWVSPGGGLPSGVFTARSAIKAACHQDGLAFAPR